MAETFDTILKGATIVNHDGIGQRDVGIRNGRIAAIGSLSTHTAGEVIDCTGLHILPGVVDSQVHFREPGLTHKGDIASESAAAVAGGLTSFMDMPNTNPATLDLEALADKQRRAALHSVANYGFHFCVSNDNLDIVAALAAHEIITPFPIQAMTLPVALSGHDIIGQAKTGTGKTLGFGIPMLQRVVTPKDGAAYDALPAPGKPQALAVAPTRELALQVSRELIWLYDKAGARIATCVGGMDASKERRNLAGGVQIVVGTPGRLRDHLERGALDLSALRVAVLDEADEMLDMGFREELEEILDATPDDRRTLLFADGERFPAEHALVDIRRAFGHRAVHGDAFAGMHGDQIPGAKPKMALLYLKDADFAAVLAKAESLRADYDVTVLPQAKKLGKQFGTLLAQPLRLGQHGHAAVCLLYSSSSPRDLSTSRMPSSACNKK